MDVYEMAKKYYPSMWDINRLRKLVEAGKLTKKQFEEITNQPFED